jgi:arylsulfatase A
MTKLAGVWPALVTPFTEDNQVNVSVLQELTEYLIQKGAGGFYVCGATGQGLSMSVLERKLVLESVLDQTSSRVPVIAQVGCLAVPDALDDMNLAENTLLIFTVDHGPARWHHRAFMLSHGSAGPLLGFKRYLWEGGIRVPGIIRWPSRIKEGQTISHPVGGVDWMPTICGLVDIDVPTDRPIDGCDISAIFDNQPVTRPIPLHWEFHHPWGGPQAVMRQGAWVITAQLNSEYPYTGGFKRDFQLSFKDAELGDFRLYNLLADIGQTTNLADHYPERTNLNAVKLQELYRNVHDEGPIW